MNLLLWVAAGCHRPATCPTPVWDLRQTVDRTAIALSASGPEGFTGRQLLDRAIDRFRTIQVDSGAQYAVEFLEPQATAWRVGWQGDSWLTVVVPIEVTRAEDDRRATLMARVSSPALEHGAFVVAVGHLTRPDGRRRHRDPLVMFSNSIEDDFIRGGGTTVDLQVFASTDHRGHRATMEWGDAAQVPYAPAK